MTLNAKLVAARAELRARDVKRYELRRARVDEEVREMVAVDELTKEIAARLEAKFGAEIREAESAQKAARKALELLEIEENRLRLAFPEGTRYEEYKSRMFSSSPPLKTGQFAILELATHDSLYPKGQSAPEPGAAILRLLKKDGTPSARWEKTGWFNNWVREGQPWTGRFEPVLKDLEDEV